MAEAMVQAESLVKIYKTKETEVMALQGLDLTIECGELTAIIGNSGSGKSTFLNMIEDWTVRLSVPCRCVEGICLP